MCIALALTLTLLPGLFSKLIISCPAPLLTPRHRAAVALLTRVVLLTRSSWKSLRWFP